jgi:hypothetical protein
MKRVPFLFTCTFLSLTLTGCGGMSAVNAALPSPGPSGASSTAVTVSAPIGRLFPSTVHYSATATTTCAKGVSAMRIYTAPSQVAYTVNGAKLDTILTLTPGTYDTVVESTDNCNAVASKHVQVVVQSATTSMAAQTANNTSTADTFQTQSNGNVGAGSVSNADLHSLLYAGSTTEIYAELQPWFGGKRHMKVGYTSWDPIQVDRQLNDMLNRGITGVIIDWYGPADHNEATTLAWIAAAEKHPGFKFMMMIDKGAINISRCQGCNAQETLIYLTNYILKHYVTSPAYATLNGKPLITQFDLDLHFTLDWPAVQAATSKNIAWIFEHAGGFTHPITSGSWSWVHASGASDYAASYLKKFYGQAAKNPSQMAWGVGFKGFNDTLASWSLNRVMGQQCGQTWLSTFNTINKYYNAGNQLPILQLATWNDYEEGTEIESGIDNCLSVVPSISATNLNWTVNGDEATVSSYVVYVSSDKQNLLAIDTLPVGSRSLDLSTFDLGSGTYSVFVQAIGKASIRNQMSSPVTYIR